MQEAVRSVLLVCLLMTIAPPLSGRGEGVVPRGHTDRAAGRPVSTSANALSAAVIPAISRAPAEVRIEARVDPFPENRWLEISITSFDYYRSSTMELDGDEAPRFQVVRFKGIPVGDYQVRVVLGGTGGQQRAVTLKNLAVVP